jgi:hypothetical protein
MKGSQLRIVIAFVALAVADGMGCGGVSSPNDGGQAGSTGSAGHGSAGSTGSAGHGGAGSTGTGGAGTGGAGSTGTAGHPSGGTSGSGGQGGGGGTGGAASCDDLANQYTAALPAANACTVGAAGQCAKSVSGSLSPCFIDCMTYVQTDTALNDLKARWMAAGCNATPQVCPAIACLMPTAGTCAKGDGGAGMCVSAAPFN